MIYLIKSASWNKEKNSFEFILKIGYTKDSSAQNRFSSYVNHNPTSEILFKISEATRRQEGALHEYFKEFRIYGREWYEYREEIIEFFKSHITKDSLTTTHKNIEQIHNALIVKYDEIIITKEFSREISIFWKKLLDLKDEKWATSTLIKFIECFKKSKINEILEAKSEKSGYKKDEIRKAILNEQFYQFIGKEGIEFD